MYVHPKCIADEFSQNEHTEVKPTEMFSAQETEEQLDFPSGRLPFTASLARKDP